MSSARLARQFDAKKQRVLENLNNRVNDMDRAEQDKAAKEDEGDLSSAISKFGLIESILGNDQDIPSEITFQLPLTDVLGLFPSQYVKEFVPDPSLPHEVSITMDDLFAQLSKGKATMSVAKLAFFVPSHLLQKEAFSDTTTMIALPLPAIVAAVGVKKLSSHMAKKIRHYKIDDIDDPFRKIFGKPGDRVAQPPAEPQVTTPAAAGGEAPAPAAAPKAEKAPPKPHKPPHLIPPEMKMPESSFRELPDNVNLNAASAEEMATLPGITKHMAGKIVAFRTQNGPFASVFDIIKVPRLSHHVFKRITGMPFSATGFHRRYKLALWLNVPVDKDVELPLLAKAVAERHGFAGCLISDKDGLLLAQGHAEAYGDNWGAVAIKIVNQVRENLQLLGVGNVEAVSLSTRGNAITIVAGRNVMLTIIHARKKLTETQLGLAQKICQEIEWLLSRRAYIG